MTRSIRQIWPRLWWFVRPYQSKATLTFLLTLLATPLSLLAPWPLRIAVDSVIGNHPMPGFVVFLTRWIGPPSLALQLSLIATMLGILEPLLILVMGVVVLLIVLAILLPIFGLVTVVFFL